MNLTRLPELLARRERDADTVRFRTTDDWLQGRTTFGGLLTVLGVQAMRDVSGHGAPQGWPLRALQVNFIAPVSTGEVEVAGRVLRQGRNVCQVQASLMQDGETRMLLVGVFGAARESSIPLRQAEPPAAPAPQESSPVPFVPELAPRFFAHFALRWAEGPLPYSGGEGWQARAHLRLQGEPVDAELMTVMMADAAPSPAAARLRGPVPVSSVSWALELAPPDALAYPGDWWRIDKDVRAAAQGYVNESTTVWTPDGRAAAWGHQVMAFYG
ncbi:acyl-CoA thioesterase [Caldimonas tepidiphila]|uniref:acyl-CoA thioesterase n=1 Tax=Caldimonas tepidiphila TaxID=2315841 RepID=UPI000E5A5F23|nr:thioesterase family protein [Caldimonas tepidiphila]